MSGIERDVLIDLCWRTKAYRNEAEAVKDCGSDQRTIRCRLPGDHYHNVRNLANGEET